MALLDRIRIHTAIYWERVGTDEYGKEKWSAPREVEVRWDEKQEHAIDGEGKPTLYMASVISAEPFQKGGKLLRGKKESLKNPLPPPEEARRIKMVEAADTINGKTTYHFAKV